MAISLLVNVRFQGPKSAFVSPYIGAGAGTSIAVLDADHIDIGGPGGTKLHGSQSDAVFAYQAFGGVRFRLNRHMGLSVEYRYFATRDPHWKADNTFNTSSDEMVFGGTETHSVSAVFDFKF